MNIDFQEAGSLREMFISTCNTHKADKALLYSIVCCININLQPIILLICKENHYERSLFAHFVKASTFIDGFRQDKKKSMSNFDSGQVVNITSTIFENQDELKWEKV